MNNPFEEFEADLSAAKAGVWTTMGELRFRIRSADCDDALKVIKGQLKRQAHIRRANENMLPTETVNKNDAELAPVLVTDWDVPPPKWWTGQVVDMPPAKEGEPPQKRIPFSRDNAKALLSEPRIVLLARRINQFAYDQQNFNAAEIAALEGNSLPVSAGTSEKVSMPTG